LQTKCVGDGESGIELRLLVKGSEEGAPWWLAGPTSTKRRTQVATRPKNNKATRALSFTKIMAGITQHVTAAVVLGGQSMTAPALTAIFQAAMNAQSELDAAQAVVKAKRQTQKATLKTANATAALLHRWAEAQFGVDSPTLEDFGFTPAQPADKTAAVKAEAAAKATKTRKAKKAAVAAATEPSAEPAPANAPAQTPPKS
jgi:hypothetical protein